MNNTETIDQNSFLKKISDVFLKIIDLLFEKFLFLTIIINIALVTKPVMKIIANTSGMYMYYTSETNAVGNRPCRFWGIMAGLYTDKYLFITVARIMYFISMVLLAGVFYLFFLRLKSSGKKVLWIFAIDIILGLFCFSTERPELSLAMMVALIVSSFAVYFLIYTKRNQIYIVPVLAFVSVFIDVRTLYLYLIMTVVIIAKKSRFEKKTIIFSYMMIAASFIAFISVTVLSFDNYTAEEIGGYYEARYDVDYDLGDGFFKQNADSYTMSNQKDFILPESYFKVTPIDLVTEWIPDMAETFLNFTFIDIFQRLCYIYIPLIVIYNRLTIFQKNRKIMLDYYLNQYH